MSEFPEWLEDRIGIVSDLSSAEARDLHKSLDVLRRHVPDLDEIMAEHPTRARFRSWPFLKRYAFICR